MSEQIVEYLYYSKNKKIENIEEIFREMLSFFLKDSLLQYEFQGKDLIFYFDIVAYKDSLHVTFKYNKTGRVGIGEVRIFQNLLKEINIEASKVNLNHTTLLDTMSLYFSKKLLPYLHNYEWSLRKLIYLVSPTHFSDNWIEQTISKNTISSMKKKQKGEYDQKNLLQLMDLSDFEEYIFGENYIKIIGEDDSEDEEVTLRFNEITSEELINLFQGERFTISQPYSLWSDIFNKYITVELEEIQSDMQLIRDGRNIVGHNKEITEFMYQELVKKLKKYIGHLDYAFQKILTGNIGNEELENMADDFDVYLGKHFKDIDLTGYKGMSENLSKLVSAQSGIAKGFDLTGYKGMSENLSKLVSAQSGIAKGFDLTGYKGMSENLSKLVSAQSLLQKNIDFKSIGDVSNDSTIKDDK